MTEIVTTVTQLISAVGFPIVAFLLMYRSLETTIKANTVEIRYLIDKIEKFYEVKK